MPVVVVVVVTDGVVVEAEDGTAVVGFGASLELGEVVAGVPLLVFEVDEEVLVVDVAVLP